MFESFFLRYISLAWDTIFRDNSEKRQPRWRGKSLFIFSSPDPVRYQEVINNPPNFRSCRPTWSHLELVSIEFDDKKWIDRFHLFGGVPRNFFWDGNGEDPVIKWRKALEAKGGVIADYIFTNGTLHGFTANWKFIRLLHRKHRSRILAEPTNIMNAGVASEVYGGGTVWKDLFVVKVAQVTPGLVQGFDQCVCRLSVEMIR